MNTPGGKKYLQGPGLDTPPASGSIDKGPLWTKRYFYTISFSPEWLRVLLLHGKKKNKNCFTIPIINQNWIGGL